MVGPLALGGERPVVTVAEQREPLEKKIADQQRLIEKLVRLQQQYLQSLVALMPDSGGTQPLPPTPPEVVAKAEPAPTPGNVVEASPVTVTATGLA